FKEHGLEKYLGETTLADKGYVGLGLLTPTKRKPGLKMPKVVKDNNRVINKLRVVVERVIAQIKTWRVLHSVFRRPLGVYGRVFSSGEGVGVFGCWAPLMNKPQKTEEGLSYTGLTLENFKQPVKRFN
ncbi:MAG TPA: transposase family protein, partial [Candidatus Rothia avicola]|nr:transposase family protein [Candidatus Rothia avicola]